jgi:large subunit ribosomal protein L21
MYAVVVTGGKQYRVMTGETIRVEKLETEAGQEVKFDQILMLGDGEGVKLGDALKGATVTATVKSHGRADKVLIKFRRRKHHKKQMGHRQHYTEIEITGIAGGDSK